MELENGAREGRLDLRGRWGGRGLRSPRDWEVEGTGRGRMWEMAMDKNKVCMDTPRQSQFLGMLIKDNKNRKKIKDAVILKSSDF